MVGAVLGTSWLGEPSLGGPKTEGKVKEVDEIKVVKDESWEKGLAVWEPMHEAQLWSKVI